jgi:hypothetical protein
MGRKKGEVLKTAFDSYTILGQIGAGGSGEVYEVRDSITAHSRQRSWIRRKPQRRA